MPPPTAPTPGCRRRCPARSLRPDASRRWVATACLVTALLVGTVHAFGQDQPEEASEERDDRPRLPDPVYQLERVELTGEFSTSPAIIMDALALEHGQEVNVSILREAQTRLLATGYFNTAQFGLEPGSERGWVVVRVVLEERNTVLLSDVFLGTSQRSTFWGGVDVVDGNLFGIGHTARAAFVAGAQQLAFELGYEDPALFGGPVSVGLSAHFSSGVEPVWAVVAGNEVPYDPFELEVLRAGGRLSAGFYPLRRLGVFVDLRAESIQARTAFPELTRSLVHAGTSTLATGALTLELDTRDDPVMPRDGLRVNLSAEGSHDAVLSDYDHLKLLGQLNVAWEFSPGHILRGSLFAGHLFGDAPYFERFFVGDFNDLLPARNLGLNFASRPATDFFNTGADQLAYENIVVRADLEYAIPILDRIDWIYRTEFFLGGGVYGATTAEGDRADAIVGLEPTPGPRDPFPIDLTVNLGLRVETSIGIFGLSFANGLALIPF